VFPLRDVIPSRTIPFVTITLIVANVFGWLYELTLSEHAISQFLQSYGLVPARFAPASVLTSMFLHGGWFHLISNMWFLWIFGDNVEDRMGHRRFLIFYLLCGAGAAVGHVMMEPDSLMPTVGASGAVAGVMGAYLVLYPRSRVLTLVPLIIVFDIIEVPAILLLGLWFMLQVLSATIEAGADPASGGVAFVAHVAGFVMGVLGVFVFRNRHLARRW
jgi:membrane associated rhomboid family serine protease